jgi:hypothetical protein
LAAAWRIAWRHLGRKLALTRQFNDGSLNMAILIFRAESMTDKQREPREPIYELDKKIEFLRKSSLAREICGHSSSENSFCHEVGIARSTLRGALKGDKPNMLASTPQGKLADKCRFELRW